MEIGHSPVRYDYRRAAYVLSDFPRPKIVSVANVMKRGGVCVCADTGSQPREDRCREGAGWLLELLLQLWCVAETFVL